MMFTHQELRDVIGLGPLEIEGSEHVFVRYYFSKKRYLVLMIFNDDPTWSIKYVDASYSYEKTLLQGIGRNDIEANDFGRIVREYPLSILDTPLFELDAEYGMDLLRDTQTNEEFLKYISYGVLHLHKSTRRGFIPAHTVNRMWTRILKMGYKRGIDKKHLNELHDRIEKNAQAIETMS